MKSKSTRLLLFFALAFSYGANAQMDYPGFRSGNYIGVNGVFFNPANIADSRYRWDVNLFGINAGIGNNNASFKFGNLDAFNKLDSAIFGKSAKKSSAAVNIDILGPSFMFNATKKLSFAFTTRARVFANIKDIDGQFIQSVNNTVDDGTLPFRLSSNATQKILVHGWTEFGLSGATTLYNKGVHFLKGGATVKYLGGGSHSFAQIAKLNGTVDDDISGNVFITDASGSVAVGNSGYDFENLDGVKPFKFEGKGVGADIGFVYEYRPDPTKTGADQNKYKFKVGLALLDFGSIKYEPKPNSYANYAIAISPSERWNPEELEGNSSVSEIKEYLDTRPAFFTNQASSLKSYKAALPTTLQLNADYHLHRGFYVDLGAQLSLSKRNGLYSAFAYNSITLTPRFETKAFGVYIPLNYNELTNLNAGLSLRGGPLYFGSGSMLTALFGKSKQIDFHIGARFGILHKKKKAAKVEPVVVAPPADTDADGVFDSVDDCPQVAGLLKYKGCPIPDTDKDGINDEEDKCMNVAGILKYQGCPIPDTDKDGINDEEDKCINIPGLARYQGCPIPDTDGDSVNDEEDKCVTLKGTVANFGCPEIKEEVKKKVNVVAQKILFQTGKSTLLASSLKQLDQLAVIFKQDADLKLAIEGHTDNVGKPEKNLVLSEQRANAVKAYLLKKGVDESRLSTTGFGAAQPIADNKIAVGRTKNRRVELKLNY